MMIFSFNILEPSAHCIGRLTLFPIFATLWRMSLLAWFPAIICHIRRIFRRCGNKSFLAWAFMIFTLPLDDIISCRRFHMILAELSEAEKYTRPLPPRRLLRVNSDFIYGPLSRAGSPLIHSLMPWHSKTETLKFPEWWMEFSMPLFTLGWLIYGTAKTRYRQCRHYRADEDMLPWYS